MGDVVIVGGGASGLVAAIFAARKGRKVTIIEHNDKLGKKILATGNGRCNYTNSYMDISCFRSNNINFVKAVLDKFSYEETIEFFMKLGIYPLEIKGYIYPNSQQALSVLKVLELEILNLGINILYNVNVKDIERTDKGFAIHTNQGNYQCKKIILASGGCASSNLGSDGSGFKIAKDLGHKIIKPLPALVGLRSSDNYFKVIAGVRASVYIDVYVDNKLIYGQEGEVQFTKYGVSGIPIFQLSRFVSRALDVSKRVKLKIDLLPDFDWKDTMDLIEQRISNNPYKNMEEIFYGLFNNKLVQCILKRTNISKDMPCKKLDKTNLINLVNMIKGFQVNIVDTNPLDQAQVTTGGVDTYEINNDSMESMIVKNLYFCGEILDVDGTCGGYNLQWAWSSGYLAGSSV